MRKLNYLHSSVVVFYERMFFQPTTTSNVRLCVMNKIEKKTKIGLKCYMCSEHVILLLFCTSYKKWLALILEYK